MTTNNKSKNRISLLMVLGTLALMVVSTHDLHSQITWKSIEPINAFHVRKLAGVGRRILLSHDSILYVQQSEEGKFVRDGAVGLEKVSDFYLYDDLLLTFPTGILRNRSTNNIIYKFAVDDEHSWGRACTVNDTLLVLFNRTLYVYSITSKVLVDSVQVDFNTKRPYGLACTQGKVYVLDPGGITIIDMQSRYTSRILHKMSSPREMHEVSIYNGRIVLPATVNICTYNTNDSTITELCKAQLQDSYISVCLRDSTVYITRRFEPGLCTLEKIHIEAKDHVIIDTIRAFRGTGRSPCLLFDRDSTGFYITDVDYGGLYKYDMENKTYEWLGDGISEATISAVGPSSKGIFILTYSGLFEQVHGNYYRWNNLNIEICNKCSIIGGYRDSLVTLNSDALTVLGRDAMYKRNLIAWPARTYAVVSDTLLFYSNPDGVMEYTKEGVRNRIGNMANSCLRPDSVFLAAWNWKATLSILNTSSSAVSEYDISGFDAWSLAALDASHDVVYFNTVDSLSAYSFSSRTLLWTTQTKSEYIGCFVLHGFRYLVTKCGEVIDGTTGVVQYMLPPDVKGVNAISDSCFVYYDHGCFLLGTSSPLSVDIGPHQVAANVELYPSPVNDVVHYRIHAASHCQAVKVYDIMGKYIFGRIQDDDANTIQGEFNVGGLRNGVYILIADYDTYRQSVLFNILR
jgi:hypothetical protein